PESCPSDFVLDRLIAGELAGTVEEDSVRRHIEGCARCKARVEEFAKIEAPPLEALVLPSKPSASRSPASPGRRWRAPAAAATAAAAIAVVGLRTAGTRTGENGSRTKGTLAFDVLVRRPSGEVTRLAPGGVVHPGDLLRFEVTSAQGGFVAVLGLDA